MPADRKITSTPENPQPLRTIAQAVRNWVERLGEVWVEAQVIELNRHRSGYVYVTLRDLSEEISVKASCPVAVLDIAGPLTANTTVVTRVKPRYWLKNGSLSYELLEIRPSGEGRLLAHLEQLKRMLQAEGLFDPLHKKALPLLPRRVGLVTGAGSAAERDVLDNMRRRWPAVAVEVRHTLVQGPQAAAQVMAALADLDGLPDVDVIIIARGGGSLEDLLPFSDEGLVRAVARARTPVVSAIGHEPDQPILDLVADLRASTPTDAAKRVVPDAAVELHRVADARRRMDVAIDRAVSSRAEQLAALRSRPVLQAPTGTLDLQAERLAALRDRATRAIDGRLRAEQTAVEHARQRVRALSPQSTLERGYAILLDADDRPVVSTGAVDEGDGLVARVADGTMVVQVVEIEGRDEGEFDE
ncbi:Exodeoxyribonuclease VII large subunit [Raineyella antarctica]|uniref:Exodeoxyribonuclease 7 large subunit n=1 Tax=Raineyella antarctica TaxID=1577474 RepID=A0A1G6GDA3_9ACTN|nr:exodeoxyribonuclease VII large subunit [Raineyella antarctica]SDB79971.1 Exodeoxyribonuclease VII large subunit [Raineyella antarctica]